MPHPQLAGRWRMLALAVAALGGWRSPAAAEVTIAIGVISPQQGRSGSAGMAHRTSIEWAMKDLGYYVVSGNRHVTLKPFYEDDHGNPDESVRVATKLVEKYNVVALLGPANSSCTQAVLGAGLRVPVISSLSTAPSLTAERDEWFFRATIDDRERMRRLATFLQEHELLGDTSVLVYEDDAYGRGLSASLTESLGSSTPTVRWKDVSGQSAPASALLGGNLLNLFVLGTEAGAIDIARQLNGMLAGVRPDGSFRFLFVGGGERLLADAPSGSITIGEPAPDADGVPLLDAAATVRPFIGSDRKFLLTAYEAARFVLPKALQYALASGVDPKDVPALREKLKLMLDSKSFDSLTPYRKIQFAGGNLLDPPATPIYQLNRTLVRLDPPPPASWLSITVPERTRFLEEPITIGVKRHGPEADEAVELHVLDDDGKIVSFARISLEANKGTFIFHPQRPGRFRIWSKLITVPNEPIVQVDYPVDYALAMLGGLLGVVIATRSLRVGRAAQGIAVGAVFFALSSYGRAIPGLDALPVPSFSASRPMNALLSGMIGGWGGLNMLLDLLRRLPFFASFNQPRDSAPAVPPEPAPAPR